MPYRYPSLIRQFLTPAKGATAFVVGLLLTGGPVVPARAQSSWRAAADSSNAYFAKKNYEKARNFGLKMVAEAEPLHARNRDDTTLVTSLVRVSISQRLAVRPDTAEGLTYAIRALNLLTPTLKQTLLGAKVYSLNAIFNYMAGQRDKALYYAEIAADRLEKLGMTISSPYWEVQRYRVVIYQAAKDSVSLNKAAAVLRQTLPVTVQLFGKKDSRYYGLIKLWASMLHQQSLRNTQQNAEADSVWEGYIEATRQRPGSTDVAVTNTLYDAANYYSSAGRFEKAAELAGRMLAKAETMYAANAGEDTTLIHSLSLMGNCQYQVSQLHVQKAVQYVDRAIALLKPVYEPKPWVTELYALSGRLRWNAGDQPLALAHSQKAIELSVNAKQTENLTYVQAQMTQASVYCVSRDKDQLAIAQRILESVAPVVARVAGQKSMANVTALGMLGTVYTMSMPLDDSTQRKADELWQMLIPLTRELGDPVQLCRMLNAVAEHYMAQNKTDLARTTLRESIAIGKMLTNQVYRLIALSNLSTVETATGHYPEAVQIADEILAEPETRLLPQIHLSVMANAVDGNRQLGRLDRAEALARQAMRLAEEQYGNRTNYFYALSLGALGMVHYQRSDFSSAAFYLEEALDLLDKTARPDDPVLARLRTIMGDMYASVDKEKALYNHQKARQSMERQPNYGQTEDYLSVLQSQVATLRQLGRLQASAQLADSTISQYRHRSINNQNAFPRFLEEAYYTYYRAGRQSAADSIIHRLERILVSDTLSDGTKITLLNTIGAAHQYNGNYPEAIRHLSEGIRTGKALYGNNINAYVPVRMAVCYLNLGNRPEATRLLTGSVDRLRTNVAQNLWYMSENEREVYVAPYTLNEIYGLAFQNPTPTATELGLAYDYRLLVQGLLFNTSRKVLQAAANQSDTLLRQRVQRLFSVRRTIAQYSLKPSQYVDVDSLQKLSTKLEKQIGYFAGTIRQQTKAYTWQDVRKALKPGEAAVEIIRFNRWVFKNSPHETDTVHYVALIVRPEWSAPRFVELPDGAAMESDGLLAYRRAIDQPIPDGTAYRRFWQPIAEQLSGVQKAFVTVDGVYHLISLPTLYNRAKKQFLADEMQIVLVGSTRELIDRPDRPSASAGVLLGFPAYRAQRTQLRLSATVATAPGPATRTRGGLLFEDLPATEDEVRAIAQLLSGVRIRSSVKTGREASEPTLKAVVSPRVLHIATHGFFKPDTSNRFYKLNRLLACGLALAGAADTINRQASEDEDGILTGYEASLLNLSGTELVTLSACETGVGDALASEGVFGLQRAFLLAGAQSVLMSLWKVNDQLTQQLMTDFYRYWLSGLSKPQALRRAQLNLRKQHSEPYYWGAFVLLGQ